MPIAKVSLIVPMYNASLYIRDCLDSISAQTLIPFEVILVDDASTDDTLDKIKGYPVTLLRLFINGGPAAARNCGARSASGDVLIFTDADIRLGVDAVEKAMASLSQPSIDAVSAKYSEDTPQSDFFSQFQNLISIYRHRRLKESAAVTFSFFFVIKNDTFKRIGGFNEDMSYYEDVELGHRMVLRGFQCRLDPSLKVVHLKRYNHISLLREYFNKCAAANAYNLKQGFLWKIGNDNCPLGLKISGVSVFFIVVSLFFIPYSSKPIYIFLFIYSMGLFTFLVSCRRSFIFIVKSYTVFFEISVMSLLGLIYGALKLKNA
ncbi:MAG: glycosyltransferase [Candidatus Omnitrophica bacterium]|nr:glycosyltransferase [Candidatus Omnitrophota bacterium]